RSPQKSGRRAGPSRRGDVCDEPRRIATPRLHADGCGAMCAGLLLAAGAEGRTRVEADGRAVGAVSALWVSTDCDLPPARRARHEFRASASLVARGQAAAA